MMVEDNQQGNQQIRPLPRCVICGSTSWPAYGRFCYAHRRFATEWSAVATGRRSDWEPNTGGYVSQVAMQTRPEYGSTTPWYVVIGDINRMARMWLDGWHYGTDSAAA